MQPTPYEEARKKFFMLEPGQSIVISMKAPDIKRFRDSIYKLSKRYRAYDKLYKTKLINTKKLQLCRVK